MGEGNGACRLVSINHDVGALHDCCGESTTITNCDMKLVSKSAIHINDYLPCGVKM